MPLAHSVEVGVDALVLAMTSAELGEPHLVLRGEAAVLDAESRWDADQAHWHELGAAGLLGGGGVPRPVAEALRPLARGHVQYFGWLTVAGTAETSAALVGSLGAETTLAVRRGQAVRISSVPAQRPAESLLSAFGQVGAARGRAVSVDTAHGGPDVDRLAAMARVPAIATAELYVTIRDGLGRVSTTGVPIRFRDTDEGRWAVFSDATSITVVPAARGLLADRLDEARRGLSESKSVVF
jgi:hypothetical protein